MDLTFYESLLKKYGTNEPIFFKKISFENYSRPWLLKQLRSLCEEGKLIHYEKGVYYIPTDTHFGKSLLDPRKVIEQKYIRDMDKTVGYYSGTAFQNRLKLTTQVPNVIELYTNNETAKMRKVAVGKQKVILRRARTPINNENAAVLSFLEMMNDITPQYLDQEKKGRIMNYISENGITKRDILYYASVFPDKVMRNLIESEAIFDVAQ